MQPLILLSGCNTPGFSHIQKKGKKKYIFKSEREEDQDREEGGIEEGGLRKEEVNGGKYCFFFTLYN